MQFILRLLARVRSYKQLLTAANFDELRAHPSPFVTQQIPRIQSTSFGYNPRIYKAINHLLGYAQIKKLETATREQKLAECDKKKGGQDIKKTKAQRQLAEEASKENQTPPPLSTYSPLFHEHELWLLTSSRSRQVVFRR